jgi:hypothetical protein
MRAWWMLAVLVACKGKPDCDKYAAHLAEIGTAGMPADELERKRKSVEFAARESCTKGDVSTSTASCVIAAATTDEIRKCEGLEPLAKATGSSASAAKRVQRKGFSVALPAGWTAKTDKMDPSEVLLRGPSDPAGAFISRVKGAPHGIESDIACRGIAAQVAKNNGATIKAAQITQTKLGPSCHTVLLDPKMVVQADSVAAGGDTMAVTCFYELTRSDPPAYCAELLASLTIE